MPIEVLLLIAALKATLLIGAALLFVICVPRTSAALRHAVLLAALIGAMSVPLLGASLPTLMPSSITESSTVRAGERGRWADNALVFLMARSDTTSVVPVHSTLRAGVESRRVWILTIWLAGTIVALARIGSDVAAARRVVARASSRAWLGPGVPLLESAEIGSPLTVGLLRPAILIPKHVRLGTADHELVIAHELAHVKRRD